STADALVITTLLIAGLIYGTGGPVLGGVIGMISGPAGAGSTESIVFGAGFLLAYAGFLVWLLWRGAPDYLKGAALVIERKKGELPEMRYTLQLTDPDSPPGKDRPRDV